VVSDVSKHVGEGVVYTYDFSGANCVADVGGGHGTLLAAVLSHNAHLKGVLFDLPHVVQGAGFAEELSARIERVGGSFFESVPGGVDVYLLKSVLGTIWTAGPFSTACAKPRVPIPGCW
jgi:hypothetical protein